MNTDIQHNHGSGNWVAFLFGAIFNLIVTITYRGLIEYAIYSLVGSVIAGAVWLFYKKIGDRLGLGTKKENPLDKLIDKPNQNGHAKD